MRISDWSSDVCSSDLEQAYDASSLLIAHQSPKSPRRWIRVDLANGEQTVVQQQKVANFDPEDYQVERLFAPARDGEMVPITLLSRRGAPKPGKAPLLQYGYGAYGVPSDPEFSIHALAPVDSGWRYETGRATCREGVCQYV